MSTPPLARLESELDNMTKGIDALQVEAIGETSSCTKRPKLSAVSTINASTSCERFPHCPVIAARPFGDPVRKEDIH